MLRLNFVCNYIHISFHEYLHINEFYMSYYIINPLTATMRKRYGEQYIPQHTALLESMHSAVIPTNDTHKQWLGYVIWLGIIQRLFYLIEWMDSKFYCTTMWMFFCCSICVHIQ